MIGNVYEIKEADGTTAKGVLTAVLSDEEFEITFDRVNKKVISAREFAEATLLASNEAKLATSGMFRELALEFKLGDGKAPFTLKIANPYYLDLSKYPLTVSRVRDILGGLNQTAITKGLDKRFFMRIGKMVIDEDNKEIRLDKRKYAGFFKVEVEEAGEFHTIFQKYYTFEDYKEYTGSFQWADTLCMNFLYESVGTFTAVVEGKRKMMNQKLAESKVATVEPNPEPTPESGS
jgi:hypothetical protein